LDEIDRFGKFVHYWIHQILLNFDKMQQICEACEIISIHLMQFPNHHSNPCSDDGWLIALLPRAWSTGTDMSLACRCSSASTA
jgi:hypothetical protein